MTIRNLEFVLRPRSIAVIGASNNAGSVGHTLTKNVLAGGFAGPVYLVNPKHRRIAGQDCFLSIDELPEPPELAVIATPPETIPSLISALGERGTRAAVVITSGLGPELRQATLNAARPTCLRIVGPNCLGIWVPALGVNANFGMARPMPGKLAFLSQSGALVGGVLDWAQSRGIGFSYVVSMGDMADVDVGDLLDFLAADVSTERHPALSRDDPRRAQIHVGEPVGGARQAGGGDQVRTERSLGASRGDPYRRACGQRRSGASGFPPRRAGTRRRPRRPLHGSRDLDLPEAGRGQ